MPKYPTKSCAGFRCPSRRSRPPRRAIRRSRQRQPPKPGKPDKRGAQGQQRASGAREQGREFGQQASDDAKQRSEEAERNKPPPPGRPDTPPAPPADPPGRPNTRRQAVEAARVERRSRFSAVSLLLSGAGAQRRLPALPRRGSPKARAAFDAGDFPRALAPVRAMPARWDCRVPPCTYNIGVAAYRSGDFARAESAFREVARTPAMAALAHYNLGLVALKRDDERCGARLVRARGTRDLRRAAGGARGAAARRLAGRAPATASWSMYARGGVGYDDNVALRSESIDTPGSGEDDSVRGAAVRGQLFVPSVVAHRWRRGLASICRLDEFDQTALSLGVAHGIPVDAWYLELGGYATQLSLGGDVYERSTAASAQATRTFSVDGTLRAQLRVARSMAKANSAASPARARSSACSTNRAGDRGFVAHARAEFNDSDDEAFASRWFELGAEARWARRRSGRSRRAPPARRTRHPAQSTTQDAWTDRRVAIRLEATRTLWRTGPGVRAIRARTQRVADRGVRLRPQLGRGFDRILALNGLMGSDPDFLANGVGPALERHLGGVRAWESEWNPHARFLAIFRNAQTTAAAPLLVLRAHRHRRRLRRHHALVIQAMRTLGASVEQTGSAVTALCLGIAIGGAVLSLKLRMPIVLAWSTPGAALLAAATPGLRWPVAIGVFSHRAGSLMVIARPRARARPARGAHPALDRVRHARGRAAAVLPRDASGSGRRTALLVAVLVGVFILARLRVPLYALLLVLVAGIAITLMRGDVGSLPPGAMFGQLLPTMPAFDARAMLSLALPLFLVTLVSQNLPGLIVLRHAGYEPMPGPLIVGTGALSLVLAPFGAHAVNLAAITAAICTNDDAHPDRAKRWTVAVIYAGFYLLLAIFSPALVRLFLALPHAVIAALTGLALIPALMGAIDNMLTARTSATPRSSPSSPPARGWRCSGWARRSGGSS